MSDISFTLKALTLHMTPVQELLEAACCSYVCTGTVFEKCGTEIVCWYISEPANSDEIGIEQALRDRLIPYDTTQHGLEFKPLRHCRFRLDDDNTPQLLLVDHGDNTLDLLDELETAIAGNDYAFARNFIARKRRAHLQHLGWASQQQLLDNVTHDR